MGAHLECPLRVLPQRLPTILRFPALAPSCGSGMPFAFFRLKRRLGSCRCPQSRNSLMNPKLRPRRSVRRSAMPRWTWAGGSCRCPQSRNSLMNPKLHPRRSVRRSTMPRWTWAGSRRTNGQKIRWQVPLRTDLDRVVTAMRRRTSWRTGPIYQSSPARSRNLTDPPSLTEQTSLSRSLPTSRPGLRRPQVPPVRTRLLQRRAAQVSSTPALRALALTLSLSLGTLRTNRKVRRIR